MSPGGKQRAETDPDGNPSDGVASAVQSFVGLVEALRAKTTGRVLTVARAIVFALVITTMAVAAVALATVAAVRALDLALPRDVWLAYLVAGAAMGLVGAVLWRLRRPKKRRDSRAAAPLKG